MSSQTNRTSQQVSTHLRIAADLMEGSSQFESSNFTDQYQAKAIRQFNTQRLLNSLSDTGADPAVMEQHVGATAGKSGQRQSTQGAYIPFSVLTRDLMATTASAGGNTIGKQASTDVAEWLRPNSFVAAAGATFFQNLRDQLTVPFLTGGATGYLVGESVAPSASQPIFGQVQLQPFTLAATTVISRRLYLQSPEIAALVSNDLSAAVGQALDNLVMNGSGVGDEPLGLLNNSSVNIHAMGANGAAITWAALSQMEYLVDQQNSATNALAYVTSPKIRRDLRSKELFTGGGVPVWTAQAGREAIAGVPAFSTNHVPTNLVKGTSTNCSAVIYGNWSEVLIGMWGDGIEVRVDPRGAAITGAVRVTALLDVAVAVRRPLAFAVCKDAVTS